MLNRLVDIYARMVGRGTLEERDAIAGTFRFIGMGLISTAAYFCLVMALYAFGLAPTTASFVALVTCWGLSWQLQRNVTFRAGSPSTAEIVRFVAMSLAGLVVAHVTILLVHQWAGLPVWFAFACVCVTIPVMNFLIMNFWVFKPQER